jgi:hypothetical protein
MNGARLSELECRLAAEMSLAPLAGAQREHAKWRVSLLFIARPLRTSGKKAPPGLAFDGAYARFLSDMLVQLSAPPDERPASTVIDELTTPVLNVTHAGAQRSAWSGRSRTGNTTDDSADRASHNRTSHNAGCGSCALLWGLARRGCEADHGCENELTHGLLPAPRYGTAVH